MNYRLPNYIGHIIQIMGTAWSLETAVKDIVRKATLFGSVFWKTAVPENILVGRSQKPQILKESMSWLWR